MGYLGNYYGLWLGIYKLDFPSFGRFFPFKNGTQCSKNRPIRYCFVVQCSRFFFFFFDQLRMGS